MPLDPRAAMRARDAVPGIPRDAEGPVFREPWEAQAFAMTLALHERGLFTWPEWAAALARRDQARAGRRRSRHRRDLLPALAGRARAARRREGRDRRRDTLQRYRDAWDHAADRTPHGEPIELRARISAKHPSCARSPCSRSARRRRKAITSAAAASIRAAEASLRRVRLGETIGQPARSDRKRGDDCHRDGGAEPHEEGRRNAGPEYPLRQGEHEHQDRAGAGPQTDRDDRGEPAPAKPAGQILRLRRVRMAPGGRVVLMVVMVMMIVAVIVVMVAMIVLMVRSALCRATSAGTRGP